MLRSNESLRQLKAFGSEEQGAVKSLWQLGAGGSWEPGAVKSLRQ